MKRRTTMWRRALGPVVVLAALCGCSPDDVLHVSQAREALASEQAKLEASNGAQQDLFGHSVSVDGDTALAGAYAQGAGAGGYPGAAYAFVRSGTTWSEQQQLVASDGEDGDQFGYSVSVEGDTALAGAHAADLGADIGVGAAYVFTRTGTAWSERQKLAASDRATGDGFGASVALDGVTALIGAPFDRVGSFDRQGSAYVFVRAGTTWTEQQKLVATDGRLNDQLGWSVAIDGDTALVGAHSTIGGNTFQGAAYVFVRNGTTWTQQQKLVASDGAASDLFGGRVALSGNTAVIGAHAKTVGSNDDQGAAYVFVRSGTTWAESGKLVRARVSAGDRFGFGVALAGNTAVVGAYNRPVGTNLLQGSAYWFERSGNVWTEQEELIASDGAGSDNFGYSVAISGNTVVAGAHQHASDQGAAYVFTLDDPGTDAGGGQGGAPPDSGVGGGAATGGSGGSSTGGTSGNGGASGNGGGSGTGGASGTGGTPGRPPSVGGTFQPCKASSECATEHCADGVCCDSDCTEPCRTCALPEFPGKCVDSPAGVDLGNDCGPALSCLSTCGPGGQCIGADTGTACQPPRCIGPARGLGPAYCPAAGASCATGDAVEFDCAPYACAEAFGACRNQCALSSDCAPGYVCNTGQGQGVCVRESTASDEGGCGCRTASRSDDPRAALFVTWLVALVGFARRLRMPRARRWPIASHSTGESGSCGSRRKTRTRQTQR